MDSGKLDRRVTLEVNTPASDSFGQELDGWTTLAAHVSARFTPTGGAEGPAGKVIVAAQTAVFRIRWRKGIDPKLTRIRHDGEIWDIKDVSEPAGYRRQYLDLTATAHEVRSGS
jgi:SPP1 family predicted phage head-tail adaptor